MKHLCTALAACALLASGLAGQEPLSSDNHELELRLEPLKKRSEQGDLHSTQQVYLRYGVEGLLPQARAWAARYHEQLAVQASGGDTRAMLQLGSRYLTGGDYSPTSIEKAVEWFTKAAEAGEAAAAYVLGEIFTRQGNAAAAEQHYKQAYELYTRRSEQKPDAEALYWLGFMEQNGIGTARDTASGIAKLEQAASLGSAWAAQQLFKTYIDGIGAARDEAKAISYARKLADEQNDGTMAYVTASAYLFGKGVTQDTALGERYLDQAVRANIPDAIYMKANRLETSGQLPAAIPLYKQAASMQQREALARYGSLLLHGSAEEPQDEERGLFMLELAANRFNSPQAAWELAEYYAKAGEDEMADSWHVAASDRGIAQAMARRGVLHLIPGGLVSWSPTQAYRWWRIGSQAGDATCTLYLRLFYYLFIPLLLILVFGAPLLISRRIRRGLKVSAEDL